MERAYLGETGVRVTRIILGCGNFGGIGSAPEFFGEGESRERGVRDHGRRLGGGHHDVRHRRRVRRRPQRDVHRRLAAHEGRGGPRRDRALDEDVQPDGRGRGPRPRAGAHPAPARVEPRAGSASSASTSTSPTPGIPTSRSPRRPARSTSSSRQGKIGAYGLSNVDGAGAARGARAGRASAGCRTRTRCSTARPRPRCCRSAREHGLGFTPFSPLAGGWLTGKYRRGEAPPPGSRMTLRPEPYEHLATTRSSTCSRRSSGGRRRAGRRGGARARLAARAIRGSRRSIVGPRRPAQLEPALAALTDP